MATMEHENENFEKHTFLKRIVKNPYHSVLGTFAQIRVDGKLIYSVVCDLSSEEESSSGVSEGESQEED